MPPGPPRDVTANKTCKEITLIWKRPFDNGGMAIANYIITVLSDGIQQHRKNVGGLTVEHNIDYNFTSNTRYVVQIVARSEVGSGAQEELVVDTEKFCEYLFLNIFRGTHTVV